MKGAAILKIYEVFSTQFFIYVATHEDPSLMSASSYY